jgi:hypothetical protein
MPWCVFVCLFVCLFVCVCVCVCVFALVTEDLETYTFKHMTSFYKTRCEESYIVRKPKIYLRTYEVGTTLALLFDRDVCYGLRQCKMCSLFFCTGSIPVDYTVMLCFEADN